VSQWGHGEDQDTLAIKAYNATLADPILIVRSPAHVHQMNGLEPQVKRVHNLANKSALEWTLGWKFDIDLRVAAVEHLNDNVALFSSTKELQTKTRYQLFMRDHEVRDITNPFLFFCEHPLP